VKPSQIGTRVEQSGNLVVSVLQVFWQDDPMWVGDQLAGFSGRGWSASRGWLGVVLGHELPCGIQHLNGDGDVVMERPVRAPIYG
jgi:hypothetical protein